MEIMRYCPTEKILAVYFNCKNELLGYEEISKGTKNEVLLDPALVFKIGFNFNAYSLVLVHNHPSGDPSPSVADYNMTKRLKECGAMLGIDVKDHIIIGDNVYYSFFERNVLKA
jgi:DNA repair protein RadC